MKGTKNKDVEKNPERKISAVTPQAQTQQQVILQYAESSSVRPFSLWNTVVKKLSIGSTEQYLTSQVWRTMNGMFNQDVINGAETLQCVPGHCHVEGPIDCRAPLFGLSWHDGPHKRFETSKGEYLVHCLSALKDLIKHENLMNVKFDQRHCHTLT